MCVPASTKESSLSFMLLSLPTRVFTCGVGEGKSNENESSFCQVQPTPETPTAEQEQTPMPEGERWEDTPTGKQYVALKERHPNALLVFRVGDGYEMFGEDAKKAGEILGIRVSNPTGQVEQAGFGYRDLDSYLPKLIRAGQRVAICDQIEDQETAKKLIKRGITEVVSPELQEQQAKQAEGQTDRQGNPIDADGKLIVEKVSSVNDLTDEDFTAPTRTVELPQIPENVDKAIGAEGKPVVIKKNIFEKNIKAHPDLSPEQSRDILTKALYSPNLVGQTQPITRPHYWVAIRTADKNSIVVLEINRNKDNTEIVGWRFATEEKLEQLKRQAEREGGQFLIQTSEDAAAALSALPFDSSSESKGSNVSETTKGKGENIAGDELPAMRERAKAKADGTTLTDKQVKSIDVKSFVAKENDRPVMRGVYYKDGYMVASDGHKLIKVKANYPKEYEGKVIDAKTGKVIEGKYPNAIEVLATPLGDKRTLVPVDVAELRRDYTLAKELEDGLKGDPDYTSDKTYVELDAVMPKGHPFETYGFNSICITTENAGKLLDVIGKAKNVEVYVAGDQLYFVGDGVEGLVMGVVPPKKGGSVERANVSVKDGKVNMKNHSIESVQEYIDDLKELRDSEKNKADSEQINNYRQMIEQRAEGLREEIRKANVPKGVYSEKDLEDPRVALKKIADAGDKVSDEVRESAQHTLDTDRISGITHFENEIKDLEKKERSKAKNRDKIQKAIDAWTKVLENNDERGTDAEGEGAENDNATLFRRGDGREPSGTITDVDELITSLEGRLGQTMRRVNSIDEVDNATARKRIERDQKNGTHTTKGWYDTRTGEMVIYMPYCGSAADAARTVLHEIKGHKGLRNLLGDRFDETMSDIYRMLPEKIRQQIDDDAEKYYNGNKNIATEEFLAERAEKDGPKPAWWRRVLARIKAALRQLGFNVTMSDADIDYLLWKAEEKLRADGASVLDHAEDMARSDRAEREAQDEELVERRRAIDEIVPTVVDSKPMNRDDAKQEYSDIGAVTNKGDGRVVKFYKSAFDKNYKEGGLFAKAIPAFRSSYENSVYAFYEGDTLKGTRRPDGTIHKEHPNILGYHNYIGKINIDGINYYVRFTVQEEKGKPRNGLHSAFVSNIELYNEKTTNAHLTGLPIRQEKDFTKVVDTKLRDFFERAKIAEENLRKNNEESNTRLRIEDDKTLVGVHNITEEKLRKGIRLGGLANPSVAVYDPKKYKHTGNGEISFVLPSEKIDARTGKNAGTWLGDARTPMYPKIELEPSNKGWDRYWQDLSSVPEKMRNITAGGFHNLFYEGEFDGRYLEYLFLQERGEAPEIGKKNDFAIRQEARDYIEDNGLEKDFERWVDSLSDRYDVRQRIWNGYTPIGNRRYINATLEAISKWMKRQGRAGVQKDFTGMAALTDKLKPRVWSLRDIRANRHRLEGEGSKEEEESMNFFIDFSNDVLEIGNSIREDGDSAFAPQNMIIDALENSSYPKNYIKRVYDRDITDEQAKKLLSRVEYIKNNLTAPYFETKFERPVRFNEFAAVVVPDDVGNDIREYLEGVGLPIYEYKRNSSADRQRAMDEATQQEGVLFRTDRSEERRRRAGERAVEALRRRGVDVVVDADEMQKVLDQVQGQAGTPQYLFVNEREGGRKYIGEDRRTGEKRYIDFTRPDRDKVRRDFEAAWREYRSQHPDIKTTSWGEGEYTYSQYPVVTFPNGSEVRIRIADHTKGYTEEELDNYEGNGISWCPIYSYKEGKPIAVKGVEAYIDISRNRMGAEELMQFIDKMAEYDRDGFPEGLLELADAGEKDMLQKTGIRLPYLYVEDPRILQSFGMDIAPVEGTKERKLRLVNYRFNKELSDFDNYERVQRYYGNEDIANGMFAGKPAKEHIFQLGMPSDELLSAGVQDLPLELSASTLIEKSSVEYKKNHPFEIESIKDLPVALAHPIAVFKSLRDGERTKVILVELKEGDNNFIVAITPRKNKNMVVVNDTKSLYPKDSKLGIISWINKKLLKGVDKNKFSDYFSTQWPNDTEHQEIKPEIRDQLSSAAKIVEDFDSTKSFGENIVKNGPQYLKTPDGEIYGFTYDGKIYLDPRVLDANTPVHEYTHLFDLALMKDNPELWKQGIELLKQTPLWQEMASRPEYRDIAGDDDKLASEVHARLAGPLGQQYFERLQAEIDGTSDIFEKAEKIDLLHRLRRWLDSAMRWVKDKVFGQRSLSLDEFAQMPLNDLLNGDETQGADEGTRFRIERDEGEQTSLGKDRRNELARATERYNADLDAFARGEKMSAVHLGVPSPALRASGLNGTEMYITRPTLRTHLKKHNLTIDDIHDLPNALENPLLVYEWGSKARSLIVITEIPHGDDRITVAVKLERNGKIVEVNEIASVHAKEVNRFFSDMAKTSGEEEIRSKFKWVGNKEEALKWLGLDSPKESGPQPPNELSVANVIKSFENPKIPEENNASEPHFRIEPTDDPTTIADTDNTTAVGNELSEVGKMQGRQKILLQGERKRVCKAGKRTERKFILNFLSDGCFLQGKTSFLFAEPQHIRHHEQYLFINNFVARDELSS